MTITFHMVGRLYGKELIEEAKRVVATHGAAGKGDGFGAKYILACEASYVRTCAQREVTANPTNKLAQQLSAALTNALS